MPISGYSNGRDIYVSIVWNGTTYPFTTLDDFDSQQEVREVEVDDVTTGESTPINIPRMWRGTLRYTRGDNGIDQFIAAVESGYFDDMNVLPATMIVVVNEPSGTVTKYKFTKVQFNLEDAGKWNLQETVKQTLRFRASRRLVA